MSRSDVVRAWKDPAYRRGLSADELNALPQNPAGLVELSDEELRRASGLYGPPQTTNIYCTVYTWRNWRSCCP